MYCIIDVVHILMYILEQKQLASPILSAFGRKTKEGDKNKSYIFNSCRFDLSQPINMFWSMSNFVGSKRYNFAQKTLQKNVI